MRSLIIGFLNITINPVATELLEALRFYNGTIYSTLTVYSVVTELKGLDDDALTWRYMA